MDMTDVTIKMLMISDSSFEVAPLFCTTLWHSMSTPYYPGAWSLPPGQLKELKPRKIAQNLAKIGLTMLRSYISNFGVNHALGVTGLESLVRRKKVRLGAIP